MPVQHGGHGEALADPGSVAVTHLVGLMAIILLIRSLASGVIVSHSGDGRLYDPALKTKTIAHVKQYRVESTVTKYSTKCKLQ